MLQREWDGACRVGLAQWELEGGGEECDTTQETTNQRRRALVKEQATRRRRSRSRRSVGAVAGSSRVGRRAESSVLNWQSRSGTRSSGG